MTEEPGSDRWNWLAEGNAKQARKRVSADVLIKNENDCVLLVDPSYKDGWDLPGGMMEANEEPRRAARRELREELDLDISIGRLLNIAWVEPHGPWDDLIAIIFNGGTLSNSSKIDIADAREILDVRFFPIEEARMRLKGHTITRFDYAITALDTGDVDYVRITL